MLERNVRKFLGLRINRVNENIRSTLVDEKRNNFYFFNNGITIVCNNFRYNAWSSENWQVKVEVMQISEGDDELLTDITIATNSQNPVDLRDLRGDAIPSSVAAE